MDVFVTGGTGVLGRPAIRRLLEEGHRGRGLAHSEQAAEKLRALGAEPIRADLFDRDALMAAVRGADAVLHLATRIPPMSKLGKLEAWRETDRIRREGTRNLVDAALAADVDTFVYPSFALLYPDSGDRWIDADSVAPSPASPHLLSTLDAEAEVARFTAQGRRGVALRMGLFYGSDRYTLAMLRMARLGFVPVPGPAEAYYPSIWIDDAAEAVVAALAPTVPAGVYDVVDDEPLTRRELAAAMARAVGRRFYFRPPMLLVRPMLGIVAPFASLSQRISNRRFKEVSAWRPQVPNACVGLARLSEHRPHAESPAMSPAR
jgi:nucleoside-diphosphate-sugar epimerase